jgi:hypothetical protein
MSDKIKADISPQLKVTELLNNYPELEEVLIKLVPAFKKLKNPVLKKTVARITSLQQAAVIGNIPLDTLINTLRQATGMTDAIISNYDDGKSFTQATWLKDYKTIRTIDIRPLLEKGEQPVSLVIHAAKELHIKETLVVVNSFVPAPLMEILKERGYQQFIEYTENYFIKLYIAK